MNIKWLKKRSIKLLIVLLVSTLALALGYFGLLYLKFQKDAPLANYEKPQNIAQARQQDLTQLALFFELDKSWTANNLAKAKNIYNHLLLMAAGMSDAEFEMAVAELVATANNAHSKVREYNRTPKYNRLPIRGHWFADGYYVIRAFSGFEDLLGTEVASIDGIKFTEIANRLRKYIGGNDATFKKYLPYLLESPELMHAAGITSNSISMMIDFRTNQGVFSQQLSASKNYATDQIARSYMLLTPAIYQKSQPQWRSLPLDLETLPLYLKKPIEQFQAEEIDPLDAFYVQFWTNNDVANLSIESFCDKTVDQFRRSGRRFLIIDQRFNNGGDMHKTYNCMQEFANSMEDHAQLFLIVGGATFSAGIYSAAAISYFGKDKVTIVGEPVGDSLISWGEDNLLVLPNSKIQIKFSTGKHDLTHGCNDWHSCFWGTMFLKLRVKSLEPQRPAPLTFTDYRRNIDPAMLVIQDEIKLKWSKSK